MGVEHDNIRRIPAWSGWLGRTGRNGSLGAGHRLKRNVQWLYHSGVRYWTSYKKAVPNYSLAILFSSFMMGEIAAATIFQQMANGCKETLFKEAFRSIGRDEARHMAICMTVLERDYAKLPKDHAAIITKQIRAGWRNAQQTRHVERTADV